MSLLLNPNKGRRKGASIQSLKERQDGGRRGIQVQAGLDHALPIASPEDAEARGGKMTNEGPESASECGAVTSVFGLALFQVQRI